MVVKKITANPSGLGSAFKAVHVACWFSVHGSLFKVSVQNKQSSCTNIFVSRSHSVLEVSLCVSVLTSVARALPLRA